MQEQNGHDLIETFQLLPMRNTYVLSATFFA